MKIVKKKRKKLRVERLAVLMLVLSLLMALASSLFLRSYNNALTMAVQKTENQITAYQTENDAYRVAIQDLSNKERVLSIAEQEGLAMNQGNVVTISNGD